MNKNVIIGLDFGTQFCSAGYAVLVGDNVYEYKQIMFDRMRDDGTGESREEIPTEICYEFNNNERYKPLCGFAAKGKSRTVYAYDPGISIKFLLKEGAVSQEIDFRNSNNRTYSKDKFEVAGDFLKFVADIIKNQIKANENDFAIEKIRIAYPDAGSIEDNKYRQSIEKLVSNAFGIEQERVEIFAESLYAADMFRRIMFSGKSGIIQVGTRCICIIDVGAGTTDMSILEWKESSGGYELMPKGLDSSSDMGGKVFFDNVILPKVTTRDPYSMIQHKIKINGINRSTAQDNALYYGLALAVNSAFEDKTHTNSPKMQFKTFMLNVIERAFENRDKEEIQFILTGGSCVMHQIINTVKDVKGELESQWGLEFNRIFTLESMLSGNTENQYRNINNMNFMSRAITCKGLNVKFSDGEIESTPTDTAYNPYAIAMRFKKGKDVGYKILCPRGDVCDKKKYYLSYRESVVGDTMCFSGVLYRIYLKDAKSNGLKSGNFISDKLVRVIGDEKSVGEKKYYYGEVLERDKDFYGTNAEISAKNNQFYVGVVLDSARGPNCGAINAYIYDANNKCCYYDEKQQEQMPYSTFKMMAFATATDDCNEEEKDRLTHEE